jgi:hypothetical protein
MDSWGLVPSSCDTDPPVLVPVVSRTIALVRWIVGLAFSDGVVEAPQTESLFAPRSGPFVARNERHYCCGELFIGVTTGRRIAGLRMEQRRTTWTRSHDTHCHSHALSYPARSSLSFLPQKEKCPLRLTHFHDLRSPLERKKEDLNKVLLLFADSRTLERLNRLKNYSQGTKRASFNRSVHGK